MSKQTKPINRKCRSHQVCLRDATIGVYGWTPGQTDVNLDNPVRVFCGQHKPRWDNSFSLRNVKLVR